MSRTDFDFAFPVVVADNHLIASFWSFHWAGHIAYLNDDSGIRPARNQNPKIIDTQSRAKIPASLCIHVLYF
ncbi:hypothetical protein [Cupriavidus pauculus]